MTIRQNLKGHIIVRKDGRCLATRHLIKISFIDTIWKPLDFLNTFLVFFVFFLPPNQCRQEQNAGLRIDAVSSDCSQALYVVLDVAMDFNTYFDI